jgi:rubrerythrin
MALSIPQAIRNAVASEEAAAKFYRALAALDVDGKVRDFLEEMAQQEVGHARSIEEAGKRLVGGELPMYADMEIERVEAAPEWKIADTITFAQALQLARENEYNAAMYYDTVADACPEPEASFFRQLAHVEEDHAHKLERML